MTLAPIEAVIEDARQGRMFILVDDEDRENEGDLVIPATHATADIVNFMATHGRGLICLALDRTRVETLELPLMAQQNGSRHETAFTISIEAREGVTTGISAHDRAHTIQTAINPEKDKTDIVSPGHIFPLVARDGGVLIRAGHTEAAVDIARLAGLTPAGVICEIMKDDGSMARLPDLIPFAEKHSLNIASIADLIAYRRRSEKLVKRIAETEISTRDTGSWHAIVYVNTVNYAEHLALIKCPSEAHNVKESLPDKDPLVTSLSQDGKPVLVRMHALNILADTLHDTFENRDNDLHTAMQQIDAAGKGIVVLLRPPHATTLSDILKARNGDAEQIPMDLRAYGIGAQILLDIGIHEMVVLTNSPKPVVGLEGYGLEITGHRALQL